MDKKKILATTPDYMATLSIEELEEWLEFKEGLLKDRKLMTVSSSADVEIIKKECSILREEVSRRRFKEVFNKIGRCPFSEDQKKKSNRK